MNPPLVGIDEAAPFGVGGTILRSSRTGGC